MRHAPIAFVLAFLAASPALAAGADYPVLKKECGSCHMTFAPSSLSRASWKLLLDGMNSHFGEDATLTPTAYAAVEEILMANAADAKNGIVSRYIKGPKGEPTPIRISDTWGWQMQHKGLKPYQFKKSKGNCVACHPKAEQGIWEEN